MSDLELLKNINDIDDDLICEAEQWKPRKARRLKIAVIAAAAAALCAATAGTAVALQNNSEYYEKTVQAVDHPFYLKLEEQGINVPEEYRTVDKRGHVWYNERMRGMLPSELFEQFGVSPLLNDNFSEVIEFKPNHIYAIRPNGVHELIDVDYGDPVLTILDSEIIFDYRLYNKISQRNIWLQAHYYSDENDKDDLFICAADDDWREKITLKDGSICYVDRGGALFSWGDFVYELNTYDKPENSDEQSIELTKQTLEALGVY